jgi:hypothetical protein
VPTGGWVTSPCRIEHPSVLILITPTRADGEPGSEIIAVKCAALDVLAPTKRSHCGRSETPELSQSNRDNRPALPTAPSAAAVYLQSLFP